MHWVSAAHALDAEVRIYDRLFTHEDPAATDNFLEHLNPHSLEVLRRAKVEPSLATAAAGSRGISSSASAISAWTPTRRLDALVFNRTVSLRDTWAKIAEEGVRELRRFQRF